MSSRHISRAERDRWQITRERFQLTDPKPPAPYRVTTPEHILPNILKRAGLEKPLWEQQLVNEWPALVGPVMTPHIRPGRLERGILIIYVKNSAWIAELRQFGEKALLDKLQAHFGKTKIKGLRLQLDPDG